MSSPAPTPSLSPATRRNSPKKGSLHPRRGALRRFAVGWSRFGSNPRLGFLGPRRFTREDDLLRLLDFLGFPWILSSELRLINGLHGINRATIFLDAASPARSVGNGAPRSRPHGRMELSIGRTYLSFRFSATKCRPSPFGRPVEATVPRSGDGSSERPASTL
jgi:hypothetical protein